MLLSALGRLNMRVIIIHGWNGDPKVGWFPWIKYELEKNGIEVIIPEMPSKTPIMNTWVPFLSDIVGKPDEQTILVGHSAGCITILRYLETIEKNIGGSVLVAGFTDDLGFKELHNYFESLILWKVIKEHCDKFIIINSDNDKYVPIKHAYTLKEKLDAELNIIHNAGHFSDEDGTKEVLEVLEAVLELINK